MMDGKWIIMVEDRGKNIKTTICISLSGMYPVKSRNVERWRQNAVDREEWGSVIRGTKALRRP
jgi:hypothetical protein